jgi:uncharacterized protein involved in exopolysaccharide biosynthesis
VREDRSVETKYTANRNPGVLFFVPDALRAIWRGRWPGIAFAGSLFGLTLLASLLMKNVYRSEAAIFVKVGRESVSLDPTVTTMQAVTVNETREFEINSILEVLKSREIAERLVDEFGPETILAGVLPGDSDSAGSGSFVGTVVGSVLDALRNFNDGRSVSLRERATRKLLKSVSVTSPKKTAVVQIEHESNTPQAAHRILERLLEIFQQEHVRINRTVGSYEFLDSQRDLLEQRALEAQEELRTAKNQMGVVSIEGSRQQLQDEITLISQQIINAKSELRAAEAKMDSLQASIAFLPDRLDTEDTLGLPNVATDGMREALYQLQIREKELAARYTGSHPLLVQIQKQLADAESVYDQQGKERRQKVSAVHPSKQQLELIFLTEKATVASLLARIESLELKRREATDALVVLNQNEIVVAQLQRKIDLAEQSLRSYADRLEQSRLDRDLQSQGISNVNVLQAATYMEKPASPPRLLLLAAGLFCGTVGGIGVSLLADSYSHARPQSSKAQRKSARRRVSRARTQRPYSSQPPLDEPAVS